MAPIACNRLLAEFSLFKQSAYSDGKPSPRAHLGEWDIPHGDSVTDYCGGVIVLKHDKAKVLTGLLQE